MLVVVGMFLAATMAAGAPTPAQLLLSSTGEAISPSFSLYLGSGFRLPGSGIGHGQSAAFSLYLGSGFRLPGSDVGSSQSAAFSLYLGPLSGSHALSPPFPLDTRFPHIDAIVPNGLTAGDTGIDVLIRGESFWSGAAVEFGSAAIHKNYTSYWNNQEILVNIDVDEYVGSQSIAVKVVNPDGRYSNEFAATINQLTVRHPRKYAPTIWPSPNEKWLPVSPLFRDSQGRTYYTDPQDRDEKYLALTAEDKIERATVYYHIYGDDPDEELVIEGQACIAYEYWFYFTFDEFIQCGAVAFNRHYHDWEKTFVFVRKSDAKVINVTGSAHLDYNVNNALWIDDNFTMQHPLILMEEGGHATCPDWNGNGIFDREIDTNGCDSEHSWGIQDMVANRFTSSQKIFGPDGGGGPKYNLVCMDALRQIVDPENVPFCACNDNGTNFSGEYDFWETSRERRCSDCLVWFYRLKDFIKPVITFCGSTVADHYANCLWAHTLNWLCFPPCFDIYRDLTLAHGPIEHAWRGAQNKLRLNPKYIFPRCYEHEPYASLTLCGVIQSLGGLVFDCPPMAVIVNRSGGSNAGMLRAMQLEDDITISPIAYVRSDSLGMLSVAHISEGIYSLSVSANDMARYQQTKYYSPEDTMLGVDGNIILVPENKSFTFKVDVDDAYGRPVPYANVTFIAEPDSIFLQTLTDSTGIAYAAADTGGTYKVCIKYYANADSISGLRGSYGDTITVDLLSICDVEPEAQVQVSTQLRQNFPNPFNPTTTIEFDLAETQHVDLAIYDVSGRRVRTIISGELRAGRYREIWNGRTDNNKIAAPGIYFYQLRAGQHVQAKKLVLIR